MSCAADNVRARRQTTAGRAGRWALVIPVNNSVPVRIGSARSARAAVWLKDLGSVSEWWFHTRPECITIAVSGNGPNGVPWQRVGEANDPVWTYLLLIGQSFIASCLMLLTTFWGVKNSGKKVFPMSAWLSLTLLPSLMERIQQPHAANHHCDTLEAWMKTTISIHNHRWRRRRAAWQLYRSRAR